MDGWVDRHTDRQMDGWTDRWIAKEEKEGKKSPKIPQEPGIFIVFHFSGENGIYIITKTFI